MPPRDRVFLLLLGLVLAACGGQPDYRVVHTGSWNGRVPPPRGPVVVTVVTPKGRYPLDEAALRRLTWVRLTTKYHPDERKNKVATFEGVRFSDLFRELGVPRPRRVRFEARDGYRIAADWRRIGAFDPMLALRMNGRPLPPLFAPAWVVFPYRRLKPDPVAYNSYWVWKLKTIVVEP